MFDSLQAAYAELTGTQLELERRVAELDESRDLFEQVLESMSEGLFLLDRTGRVVRVNRTAVSLLNRDEADIVGQPLVHLWPVEGVPTTPWQVLNRAPTGVLSGLDVEMPSATGRVVYLSVVSTLVRDKSGKITGVLIVARDLSDRKRTEETQRFLAEASAVLTSSLDLQVTLTNLARLTVPRTADWSVIDLLDTDGSIRQVAVTHIDPSKESVAHELRRRYPPRLNEAHPIAIALSTDRPVIASEVTDEELTARAKDAEHLGLLRDVGIASHIVAPLSARGRTLGAISLVYGSSGRRYDAQDLLLVEELAHRAAFAIDNARLYEREHAAAETLQRSLLPKQLPELPGIALAARYLPARPEPVGGDWYDVLTLRGGEIGMVMGDVAGRGVRAAAVMGQVRNALRALALEGLDPAAVANRLGGLMDADEMATLVYLIFDPLTWKVRYVNAGHPPPLVVVSNGSTAFLQGGSLPLGGLLKPVYESREVDLPAGSTLVLYTDGLIEERGVDLDENLARLERAAAVSAHAGLQTMLDHVLAAVLEGQTRGDDVALFAFRPDLLEPDRLVLRFPANPSALGVMRQTLRRWLNVVKAGPEEAFDITLACSEASANAIEHAYGPIEGDVEVEAVQTANEVVISVRDRGRWRPERGVNRGRGLLLIKGLMDQTEVRRESTGTTVVMRRRLRAGDDR